MAERYLGIDFGQRFIGLAIGDFSDRIALPRVAIQVSHENEALAKIADFIEANQITQLVIGLPLGLSGEENNQTKKTRDFGEKLNQKFSLPVSYEDERFTSRLVEDARRQESKKKHRQDKNIHSQSAALILQSYLDRASIP